MRRLSVSLGRRAILNGGDPVGAHGEQVALIGPNGAGESTRQKAMTALSRPMG